MDSWLELRDNLGAPRASRTEEEAALVRAISEGDLDPEAIRAEVAGESLGPFDGHDGGSAQRLLDPHLCQIAGAEAIEIEVVERCRAAMLVDQREAGTGGRLLRVEPPREALDERRLPRAEIAKQADEVAWPQDACEGLPKPPGLICSGGQKG